MAASITTSGAENRRGRPTADRAATIDATIRAAALEVFVSAGFEAASMDAIAAAAQVSKGTLYARYQSKEALFRSVLEHELEQMATRAGAQDHLLPDDLEQRLRHHARTLVRAMHWTESKRIERLVASAALSFPDIGRLWWDIGTQRYLRFLADDMAGTAHLPAGSPIDWEHLAKVFLHSIAGWHRAESAMRAVTDDQTTAFSEAVIATIIAAIHHMSCLPDSDKKAHSDRKD